MKKVMRKEFKKFMKRNSAWKEFKREYHKGWRKSTLLADYLRMVEARNYICFAFNWDDVVGKETPEFWKRIDASWRNVKITVESFDDDF